MTPEGIEIANARAEVAELIAAIRAFPMAGYTEATIQKWWFKEALPAIQSGRKFLAKEQT